MEGALAPDPAARPRVEPLREIPGLRKKERTWKDEVRERVRDRRQQRSEGRDLPLFRENDDPPSAAPDRDEDEVSEPREEARRPRPALGASGFVDVAPFSTEPDFLDRALPGDAQSPDDLPLHPPERNLPATAHRDAPESARDRSPEDPAADEWGLGPAPADQAPPVERPARWGERLQAGVVDFVLLVGLWAVVVYFAGRAAHVSLWGLWPAWPYLAGFLAFLGLLYATYFTGATGQTLGKRLTGLQVVDADGQPPGWRKALARAAVGTVGILLGGSALFPILVDPAGRGFHDRLLKTRVVKR